MKSYDTFIGIDMGKFNFVVAIHGHKTTQEYENTPCGIKEFLRDFKKDLKSALCIIEPTGGYEMPLLLTLVDKKYAVHRVHTRHVKHFIRSLGNGAKTDKLDAKNLSLYGFERSECLEKFQPLTKEARARYALVQRRRDLKQMLVAEKNRLKSPKIAIVQNNIKLSIKFIEKELALMTEELERLIEQDATLSVKKRILKTIPGIGDIIANELLVMLPELGQLTRREIASLVGLAPLSRDSGKYRGYRRTGHGREGIKPLIFLAAMAARNSKTPLQVFYNSLLARGKIKMVALTALMRKLIVIANAKMKAAVTA